MAARHWECSSVAECLSRMCEEALVQSIPSTVKKKKKKGELGVAQVVKCLPSNCSIPTTSKKKKKKGGR
jgi:hypothetical protein